MYMYSVHCTHANVHSTDDDISNNETFIENLCVMKGLWSKNVHS